MKTNRLRMANLPLVTGKQCGSVFVSENVVICSRVCEGWRWACSLMSIILEWMGARHARWVHLSRFVVQRLLGVVCGITCDGWGRSERREQVEDNVWDGGVPTNNNLLSISTKGQLSRWNHEGVCHSGELWYVNITCKYVTMCQNRTGYRSGSGTLWHIYRYGALGQIWQHRSDSAPEWYMFIDGCM